MKIDSYSYPLFHIKQLWIRVHLQCGTRIIICSWIDFSCFFLFSDEKIEIVSTKFLFWRDLCIWSFVNFYYPTFTAKSSTISLMLFYFISSLFTPAVCMNIFFKKSWALLRSWYTFPKHYAYHLFSYIRYCFFFCVDSSGFAHRYFRSDLKFTIYRTHSTRFYFSRKLSPTRTQKSRYAPLKRTCAPSLMYVVCMHMYCTHTSLHIPMYLYKNINNTYMYY